MSDYDDDDGDDDHADDDGNAISKMPGAVTGSRLSSVEPEPGSSRYSHHNHFQDTIKLNSIKMQ